MPPKIDLIGKKFGRLEVLDETIDRTSNGYVLWLCKCECGNFKITSSYNLRIGKTKSCGCRQDETKIKEIHGHGYGSKTYISWSGMIKRCLNSNTSNFKYYGERGIIVCKRWMKFENFLEDMGERPEGMSIDRINNDGNYEPSNCRWSTPKQQANNRRNNK